MKITRKILLIMIILFAGLWVEPASAVTWYAGGIRYTPANGVTAVISTPNTQLNLVGSGVSSWISTYANDSNGEDWLQAGWAYYVSYNLPKQYVEWCINCINGQGLYQREDRFATQNWGTSIDYWVERETGARWCAYTQGMRRFCVDNLHTQPVESQALSEVHDNPMNPLDTTFSNIRYKDPNTGSWFYFDAQTFFWTDFPYAVNKIADYYFQTYRLDTDNFNLFLPGIYR